MIIFKFSIILEQRELKSIIIISSGNCIRIYWLIDRVMKQQLIGRGEGNDTIAQRNGDYKSATNFSRI